MTAYMVVHLDKSDAEKFGEYEKGIFKTIKPYKGWVLAAGEAEAAVGDAVMREHNVILQFPTMELLKAWWDSEAYQALVPIRVANSENAEAMFLPGLGFDVDVSGAERYPKSSIDVLGKRMAYVEVGEGDPIVFLHGNPTSSYLWRNVIPHLEGRGRCIAPDLIGMGDSDKLDDVGEGSYRFFEHRKYLDALLESLGVDENVTLVIHDWGSGLGFDWANRHREAVKGIAYMEALVRPIADWESFPASVRPMFQGFRSAKGVEMILDDNMFVERVLPGSVLRKMGDAEMNAYRRPYLGAGESRRPTLTWPREIPVANEPADMHQVFSDYSEWLATSDVPKLFVNAEPGAMLVGEQREFCRTWPNQIEVTVPGIHFIQEDAPDQIGQAIAGWLPSSR